MSVFTGERPAIGPCGECDSCKELAALLKSYGFQSVVMVVFKPLGDDDSDEDHGPLRLNAPPPDGASNDQLVVAGTTNASQEPQEPQPQLPPLEERADIDSGEDED